MHQKVFLLLFYVVSFVPLSISENIIVRYEKKLKNFISGDKESKEKEENAPPKKDRLVKKSDELKQRKKFRGGEETEEGADEFTDSSSPSQQITRRHETGSHKPISPKRKKARLEHPYTHEGKGITEPIGSSDFPEKEPYLVKDNASGSRNRSFRNKGKLNKRKEFREIDNSEEITEANSDSPDSDRKMKRRHKTSKYEPMNQIIKWPRPKSPNEQGGRGVTESSDSSEHQDMGRRRNRRYDESDSSDLSDNADQRPEMQSGGGKQSRKRRKFVYSDEIGPDEYILGERKNVILDHSEGQHSQNIHNGAYTEGKRKSRYASQSRDSSERYDLDRKRSKPNRQKIKIKPNNKYNSSLDELDSNHRGMNKKNSSPQSNEYRNDYDTDDLRKQSISRKFVGSSYNDDMDDMDGMFTSNENKSSMLDDDKPIRQQNTVESEKMNDEDKENGPKYAPVSTDTKIIDTSNTRSSPSSPSTIKIEANPDKIIQVIPNAKSPPSNISTATIEANTGYMQVIPDTESSPSNVSTAKIDENSKVSTVAVSAKADSEKNISTIPAQTKNPKELMDACFNDSVSDWTYNEICSTVDHTQLPPSEWSNKYPLCQGNYQSPVNIDTRNTLKTCAGSPISKFFKEDDGTCQYGGLIIDTSVQGWAVIFDQEQCGTMPSMIIDGVKFNLQKFEFSLKSEHSIDGIFGDAELQMVFVNPLHLVDTVNIAILLKVQDTIEGYTEIDNYWGRLEVRAKKRDGKKVKFNRIVKENQVLAEPFQFIPDSDIFYAYLGSKTSPPCTENAKWIVIPIYTYISSLDLDSFRDGMISQKGTITSSDGSFSRPVQKLNTRSIQTCPMNL